MEGRTQCTAHEGGSCVHRGNQQRPVWTSVRRRSRAWLVLVPRGARAPKQTEIAPETHVNTRKPIFSICREKSLSGRPETLHEGGPARREGGRAGGRPGSLEEEEKVRQHSGRWREGGGARQDVLARRAVPGFQSQLCHFAALCVTRASQEPLCDAVSSSVSWG